MQQKLNKNEFIIEGINIPSSKNSKRLVRGRIIHNKLTMDFKNLTASWWKDNTILFKECVRERPRPIKIGLYFYRDSKRRFDYINIAQILFDMMQDYEWIEDDCASVVIPVFLGYENVKKDKSGVKITILE